MKKFLFTVLLLGLAAGSSAQDVKQLLAQFPTASLPYTFPEGASSDFGDEPFEHPYKQLDVATFNTITEGYVPEDTELFAVNKITVGAYHLLVVFECSFNRINGLIERRFVLYSVDASGKLIDLHLACTYQLYSNPTNFGIRFTHSTLSESEYAGEEGVLILETTETEDFRSTEGKYNERVQTITTMYMAIDAEGKVDDVTSYVGE